jgi:hypothetical protein
MRSDFDQCRVPAAHQRERRPIAARDRSRRSSRVSRPRLCTVIVLAPLALSIVTVPLRADVFHLTSGGRVEGDLIEKTSAGYRVETLIGTVLLPADSVARVEEAPSPFESYRTRRAATADTPADQYALAVWCGENGFGRQRRMHLQRALELDQGYEPARRALGYVQVDGRWVNERVAAAQQDRESQTEADEFNPAEAPTQTPAALQAYWYRYINATKSSFLDSPFPEQVDKGYARIRGIDDPLAVPAAMRVLSAGDATCRQLLVELLGRFTTDAATANLADLALCDPERDIRRSALAALRRRDDPRVVLHFRQALAEGDDLLVKRAAEGLGALNAREAVPDLIAVLTTQRTKPVPLPMGRWFNTLPGYYGYTYVGPLLMPIDPRFGVLWPVPRLRQPSAVREVKVFRTEVLEALRQITGTDFGFDADAWSRWYEEHKS